MVLAGSWPILWGFCTAHTACYGSVFSRELAHALPSVHSGLRHTGCSWGAWGFWVLTSAYQWSPFVAMVVLVVIGVFGACWASCLLLCLRIQLAWVQLDCFWL